MKLEEDKDILNRIKKEETYEIKTSATEILNTYKYQQSLKENKEKASKKKTKIISSIFGGIAVFGVAAAALAIVIGLNDDAIDENTFVTPSESKELVNELVSFASFQKDESSPSKRNVRKAYRSKEDDEETEFFTVVDVFDTYFEFLNGNLDYDQKLLVSVDHYLEEGVSYDNVTYHYESKYSYGEKEIFTIYYNDISNIKDGNKVKGEYDTIYVSNSVTYQTHIEKEVKQKDNEYEEEIFITFTNLNDSSDIYSIQREAEKDGKEIENSYSLKSYSSLKDLEDDEPYLEVCYEFESEHDKSEVSLEIKTFDSEYEFESILRKDNTFTFNAKIENKILSFDFELKGITLTILPDGSRSYVYGIFQKIIEIFQ